MTSPSTVTTRQRVLLVAASSVVMLGLLAAGEIAVRVLGDVNFLGSSRGGFTAGRFGASYGNTPNFAGQSFGGPFETDGDGFRVDPRFRPTAPAGAPAVLMLGDSVLFGPAVSDDETISGRLRRALPNLTVYNAAAVGYDTFDYRNVAQSLVPRKADVKTVVIVYCLNDLLAVSSQQIKDQLARLPDATPPPDSSPLRLANDYLRTRSKLFLLLRGLVRDAQMNYFQHDLQQYRDAEGLARGLEPLRDLKAYLDRHDVGLKVFIAPYEAQLRAGIPDDFGLPQRRLVEYFEQQRITAVDLLPEFVAASRGRSRTLYLYGDPMHLNAAGHDVAARVIQQSLRGGEPAE